ncbi:2-succinyl-6-hydroxy-2,4-cyclohexadiene-1-carboxylate synthase [Bacillus sp. 1P10SD]|uniref:2-succinyl-6-hydroxy-2, 4-cyclohexadiene-1-carboxylate synthase n=1 Tax=Bacillus sp. 1P10SD TaxID=3132265 RepID=UPI0039A47E53
MDVVVEGLNYHVEVFGNGFPLVCLHGFTGDFTTWLPFVEEWSRHSKVIIPDIIGHGQTESPDSLDFYNIEAVAHNLYKLLDHIGVEQVDVLGYSMGGRLALTFAILFPHRVRKLILESASPGLPTEKEREIRRMNDVKLANFINEHGIQPFVDYWEEIPLFSTMKSLPKSINESIRSQRLNNSSIGLANSLRGMGTGSQPSWWGRLNEIEIDVLLLTGKKDNKFCLIAEKMLKELKNGAWMICENSGHAIHVEEKEKFGTIVSDFLNT